MNVMIDLTQDILDHIENVRKAYFLSSRRAAISRILRDHMHTSPVEAIVRRMEGVAHAGIGNIKPDAEWPTVVNRFICPTCDPKKGKHCVTENGKLTDQTMPDVDNYRRGTGNERLIRWLCVCPDCNPDHRKAVEATTPALSAPPGEIRKTDEEIIAEVEQKRKELKYGPERSHTEASIDEGNLDSGTVLDFFKHVGISAPAKDRKAAMERVEGILKKLQWNFATSPTRETVYWRPGTVDPREEIGWFSDGSEDDGVGDRG